jgi:hypothetical protein
MPLPEIGYAMLGIAICAVGFAVYILAYELDSDIDSDTGALMVGGGVMLILVGGMFTATLLFYPDRASWLPGM